MVYFPGWVGNHVAIRKRAGTAQETERPGHGTGLEVGEDPHHVELLL
jgi:hypothetical protein